MCYTSAACHREKRRSTVWRLAVFTLSLYGNINTNSIMEKDNKPGKKQKEAGGSMIIGLSLGVVFGIIFDNLPVWMCLGLLRAFLRKKTTTAARHDRASRAVCRGRKAHGLGMLLQSETRMCLYYSVFYVRLHG